MSILRRKSPSLKDHRPQIEKLERRLFLKQGLSLGALSLLTGCNLEDNDTVDRILWKMSHWNDEVQAALFSPTKLVRTYSESEITNPFPFNAYYEESAAPVIDGNSYHL